MQAMCDVLKSGNAECVNPVLRCLLHLLRCQPLPSVLYRFEVVVSLSADPTQSNMKTYLL